MGPCVSYYLFLVQFYLERGIESDPHLTVYYEKLAQIQSHDSQLNPVVLQQVFSEVCVCVCVCVCMCVCVCLCVGGWACM